jgi:V8-like Glu-specific endopeptidase
MSSAYRLRLLPAFSLLCYALGGIEASTQNASRTNEQFSLERRRVLAFDTATKTVGPYTSKLMKDGSLRWRQPVVAPPGTKSISIMIRVESRPSVGSWEIHFRPMGKKNPEDVIRSDSDRGRFPEMWSNAISGNAVIVELYADAYPAGLMLRIDHYAYPINVSAPQGIIGNNEMRPVTISRAIQLLGKPVSRLRIKMNEGEALCTGFLLTTDLLITNFQCISTDEEAVGTHADFGYDHDGGGYEPFQVQKLETPDADSALDYSVVRVLGHPGNVYGHVIMPGTTPVSFEANGDRKLLVIEHPGGDFKHVSMSKKCEVVSDHAAGAEANALSDFGHHCDTKGGSSGSPVFDRETKLLVGLHHAGFDDSSTASGLLENQAVYLGYILCDIRKKTPLLYSEIMAGITKIPKDTCLVR